MRPFLRAISPIFMLRAKSPPANCPKVREKFLPFAFATKSTDWLAGAEGIEPSNAGIKIQCLTTWRRPSRSGIPITRPCRARKPAKCRPRKGFWAVAGDGAHRYKGAPAATAPIFSRAKAEYRRVAQPGRALRSGRRGRRFESSLSDHNPFLYNWDFHATTEQVVPRSPVATVTVPAPLVRAKTPTPSPAPIVMLLAATI